MPTQARSEGLTERMGDIVLQCSGSAPGATLAGNLSVALPVSVTNRVDASNQTHDVVVSVDYGNGFVPTGLAGSISNQIIAFNGLSVITPPSGSFTLKISNLRAAVYQLGSNTVTQIVAQLIFGTPTSIQLDQSRPTVAFTQPGLFTTLSDHGNITCTGSPTPSTLSLTNLFASKTAFSSTRVTEGFASAFLPRGTGDDTGTRFLIKYSGFPSNAHVYLPDFVAGSSAAAPTSAGDLGVAQAVGQYVPGSNTLLMVRVQFPNSDGSGGLPVNPLTGAGPLLLDPVSEIPLTNGSGVAVYEVVDSNLSFRESAQIPTFFGISNVTAPAVAQETISFAPVSTIIAASATAPVPRFAAVPASSDCSILNDCGASYYPHLSVQASPIQLTAIAGGAMNSAPGYIPITNSGGGVMPWSAIVSYTDGSGWLILDYTSGINNGSVRTWADPKGLAAGTYHATVTIDAGGLAGTVVVPVTLTVQAAPSNPGTGSGGSSGSGGSGGTGGTGGGNPPSAPSSSVTISQVVNAATYKVTPLVPGSLGTLMGSNLSGKNVAVTFDGQEAKLLYTGATQINLQVPAALGSKTSAQMVVTVDGANSAPYTVALSPAWPSLFPNGVLNQDNSVNGPDSAAKAGTILQIYATGIPDGATVSVLIGDRSNLVPLYAGAAPTVPGVQQVNVTIPADLAAASSQLSICATTAAGQQYCSTGYPLAVQ